MLLLPCVLAMIAVPAAAADIDDVLYQQEEAAGISELEDAAAEAGGIARYGETLDQGLGKLLKAGSSEAGGVIRKAVRSGVLLMAIVLLCGLGENLLESTGKRSIPVVSLAGTLAVAAVAMTDVGSMLGLGKETIQNITSFSNVLLPSVAAITAATGAVTGAAVRQMAAALFSDLLVNLINSLLIPILYAYLAVSIACAAIGNDGLKQLGAMLKWLATTVLTAVMLAFVAYLSLSGVVAGSADAMSIKAAKFAISGAIPVIGGILADASETILASAGVLRGSVGVFGAITVLGLCLTPVMRLSVHYLMYKLVAALSATVSTGRLSTLIDQIGKAFGLMLGMTGACGLLLLIALVSSITAVSV